MNLEKCIIDNGYQLIGSVTSIRKYLIKTSKDLDDENKENLNNLLKELKEYNNNSILYIDYDNPMGYDINQFRLSDIEEV